MLVAVGMTFVIATGGIDLSVGSLMAIASAVAAISLDYGAYPAILAALVVVTLIGAFSGWLISTFKIQPIIVTLALLDCRTRHRAGHQQRRAADSFFQSEF